LDENYNIDSWIISEYNFFDCVLKDCKNQITLNYSSEIIKILIVYHIYY
jgi:hypothetical protein